MAKNKNDEELEEEDLEGTDNDSDTSENNAGVQSGDDNQDSTDWKSAYKGLQRTTAKKQQQIDDLEGRLEKLTGDLEEAKLNDQNSESRVQDLEKQLNTVSDKLKEITADKGALDNKIARQKFILDEQPDLAPFLKFIPEGTDLESFKTNASEFAKTLGTFREQQVENDLEGSTPPPPGGDSTVSNNNKEEAAWQKVSALAGVFGKEQEYSEAYEDWLKLHDAANNQ